ncbi:SpoIIE family protein phosphatase [Streptomyces sp. NBC_00893]|uniref:SpoIIE family protein phosphatase n=1 Tax=Streptomyces sp. NBC_00893 TaxID=2975862 RepID=UPI00225B7C89|nr:SpoIIE family protein phosphatase [Streptomyces sp. NBC_00893]MCX4847653.1 SpoIIE family protein phosphatase [Streptomyces sp. NBC_00893]
MSEYGAVALPEIRVEWPEALAPALRDSVVEAHSLDREELVAALPGLWRAVDSALDLAGPGSLVAESVRHDAYEGWQVAALPRYDLDGRIRPRGRRDGTQHGAPQHGAPQLRDRRALVRALVGAVAERPCLDVRDALQMLEVFAGNFPPGLDAVCRRLLGHELRQGVAAGLAPLHEALGRRAPGGVSTLCYRESAVGSRKAKGDPATDNEDTAGALTGPSGVLRCAVFDGVTGDGDGSGGTAARAALEQAVRRWRLEEAATGRGGAGGDAAFAGRAGPGDGPRPETPGGAGAGAGAGAGGGAAVGVGVGAAIGTEPGSVAHAAAGAGPGEASRPGEPISGEAFRPGELMAELDAAVGRATAHGSAAAVLATVRPDGTASVVSVGDAEAWLIRPLRVPASEIPYTAWKLTPAHTGYAERLRITADAEGEESQLVSFLGGGTARWAHRTFRVAPGDLLLLASDGATEPERDRWFGAVLAELTAQLDASGRPTAPALAAALVQRAEALGGWDNATALVCAVGEAKD